jgi:hypothetical protein
VSKLRLWTCPSGEHPGVRAPLRLRKIDVRRYCLPCSEAAGVLTERVCAAREKRAERSKAKQRTKAQRARDQARAKREAERAALRAARVWDGIVDAEREAFRLWILAYKLTELRIEQEETRAAVEGRSYDRRRLFVWQGVAWGGARFSDGYVTGMMSGPVTLLVIPHSDDRDRFDKVSACVMLIARHFARQTGLNERALREELMEAAYGCTSRAELRARTEQWPAVGPAPRLPKCPPEIRPPRA